MVILGVVIALLLVTAVAAILMFQGFLTDLDRTMTSGDPAELEPLVRRFRQMMLVVGVLFLLLINGSIVVLIRAAAMVLRPIGALIEGGRRLAREEFEYRIDLSDARSPTRMAASDAPAGGGAASGGGGGGDEFGELAAAFNALAAQLQLNEQRKLETLRQVACTLGHEINNALAIIELQLARLARSDSGGGGGGGGGVVSGGGPPLQEIRESLRRIAGTVDALKRVRRIVLTDYSAEVKMLDLERSIESESASPGPDAGPIGRTTTT